MEEITFKTKQLRLAQVRNYDVKYNGCEVLPIQAYVFLYEGEDGLYYNVFNLDASVPIYERVPYSNTTRDGLDYGSKIILKSGEVKDGLCYILEKRDASAIFAKKEVTYEDLANYVIDSELFFVDRLSLYKEKRKLTDWFKYRDKKAEDLRKIDSLNSCFQDQEIGVVYRRR